MTIWEASLHAASGDRYGRLIEASPWTLVSVPVAVVAGFLFTVLVCVSKGGHRGGLGVVLSSERRAFGWMAVFDAIGGAVSAVLMWGASPARVSSLASLSIDRPAAFWILVGISGPLLASGIVGRESFNFGFTLRGTSEIAGIAQRIRALRHVVALHIYASMDAETKLRDETRDDWLVRQVIEELMSRRLELMRLVTEVEAAFEAEDIEKPPGWDDRVQEIKLDPSRDLFGSIVWLAVGVGLSSTVAAAARIRLSGFDFSREFGRLEEERTQSISTAHGAFEIESFEELAN